MEISKNMKICTANIFKLTKYIQIKHHEFQKMFMIFKFFFGFLVHEQF